MTDAEARFMTMIKISDHREVWCRVQSERAPSPTMDLGKIYDDLFDRGGAIWLIQYLAATPEIWPMMAQTTIDLVEENPILRPHCDRAREAWEATQ